MKKDANSPARQGITNVYELNDLLNELWHTIPPGKGRKALSAVTSVLHQRICNQQNPDCWLCQSRYSGEMVVMLDPSQRFEPQKDESKTTRAVDLKHWLNDAINANLRARHLKQKPPHSFDVLRAIHDELSRRSSHSVDCIFCLAQSVEACLPKLTSKQTDAEPLTGFKPMLDWNETDSANDAVN